MEDKKGFFSWLSSKIKKNQITNIHENKKEQNKDNDNEKIHISKNLLIEKGKGEKGNFLHFPIWVLNEKGKREI